MKKRKAEVTRKQSLLSVVALTVGLSAIPASAEITCQSTAEFSVILAVSWDLESSHAKVKFVNDEVYTGRVVYRRSFNETDEKINILVDVDYEGLDIDHAEFIAFPNIDSQIVILGSGFITVDGERRLQNSFSPQLYNCVEM